MNKLVINSQSSGEYHIEKRGGRQFIVTQMLPIQSDTVMNGLLYPARSVVESFNQLDKLPAPAGHPSFDGKSVSAFDPEGAASFNVGAFVRNPIMNGSSVVTDLVVDMEVANRCSQGKEILKRIKNGRRMGVSTGLKAKVMDTEGKQGDSEYHGIVNQIMFDHVAILLSEPPAGDFTYTLNSSEFFKPQKRGQTVMREVTINTEDLSLDNHKLIESMATNPSGLVDAINHKVTAKEAEVIVANSGKLVFNGKQSQLDDYIENSEAFGIFKTKQAEDRQEKVEFVIANSKMTVDTVNGLDESALDELVNSVTPKNKHIVNGKVAEDNKFEMLEDS